MHYRMITAVRHTGTTSFISASSSDPLPTSCMEATLTVFLTFHVRLRGFLASGCASAWPRHRWRPRVVTRPDRSVVKYVINDILAYGREAHQLRTGVGAASLEQTHPVETHKWKWHCFIKVRQVMTWMCG